MEENLPAIIPNSAFTDLTRCFLPPEIPPGSKIELLIRVDEKDLNLRELGAFLTYIDTIYGRFHSLGIYSYSHSRDKQLKITEIRKGSLDIIVSDIVEKIDPNTIAVIWLLLKYLPHTISSISSSYSDYESGRLARLNRQHLKAQMKKDEKLSQLDNNRVNQLVKFVNAVCEKDRRKLPTVIRFLNNFVKAIQIANLPKKNSSKNNAV